MKRTLIKELLQTEPENQEVECAGWVRSRRDSKGGFSFIEISDGSSVKNIQVIADSDLPNYKEDVLRLSVGSSLSVKGELAPSEGKGQRSEIRAREITVHGLADEKYPLQKKRHSFEFLREIAHLRPRTNTMGAVARLRSSLSFAVHSFFQERGFHYIHTPIISASDCEGAGQLFQVTSLDLHDIPRKDGKPDFGRDFFGRAAYLTVSGQLQAEAYALALGSVYTFGPTFRAENSNTSRHLAEFWMIEPEMAFCDLDLDADTAEDFLKYVFARALENNADDMEFFAKFIDENAITRLEAILKSEFERITYTEAVSLLEKAKVKFEYPVAWGKDLQSEHERYLTEQHFKKPIIVTDYPRDIKAFYMRLNEDEKTVRAMDVLVPKIGEIIGGSQREDRLEILRERMAEQNLPEEEYSWYLDLRRYGSVPHSGFGLGFERLLQFVSGMDNIRDVIPFPRTPRNASF